MRQATTAKVCLDLAKSGRFTVPVLSTAGFNRPLLALSTICRCPSRSKERSWPRNRGNLANVGSNLDQRIEFGRSANLQGGTSTMESARQLKRERMIIAANAALLVFGLIASAP